MKDGNRKQEVENKDTQCVLTKRIGKETSRENDEKRDERIRSVGVNDLESKRCLVLGHTFV